MLLTPTEAERRLLGTLLIWPRQVLSVDIDPAHLFDAKNRELLTAMRKLAINGKVANDLALLEDAIGADKFRAIGGYSTIAELSASSGVEELVQEYADIITREADLRLLTVQLSAVLNEKELDAQAVRSKVIEIATKQGLSAREGTRSAWDFYLDLVNDLNSGKGVDVVKTGFGTLDDILVGIAVGNVSTLAARPSVGKSSLARQIADRVSARGDGVHTFSMEDSGQALLARHAAEKAKVPLRAIREATFSRQEYSQILAAATKGNPWIVSERSGWSASQMMLEVMRHKHRNNTRLVIVDYLQKMSEPGSQKAYDVVSASMRGLCDIARRCNVALLCLCQLSRETEREKRTPDLRDLRDSGKIEEESDAVIMLHRDKEKPYDPTTVLVRKNKHGDCGSTKLAYDVKYTAFRELNLF